MQKCKRVEAFKQEHMVCYSTSEQRLQLNLHNISTCTSPLLTDCVEGFSRLELAGGNGFVKVCKFMQETCYSFYVGQ